MPLIATLQQRQHEIARLLERLDAEGHRSDEGRRTLSVLELRLQEHFNLEDGLLLPALGGPVADRDLAAALEEFQGGYQRLAEMLRAFFQRWNVDGPLDGRFRMEMDFLFSLVRQRLRLTRERMYPAYRARRPAA